MCVFCSPAFRGSAGCAHYTLFCFFCQPFSTDFSVSPYFLAFFGRFFGHFDGFFQGFLAVFNSLGGGFLSPVGFFFLFGGFLRSKTAFLFAFCGGMVKKGGVFSVFSGSGAKFFCFFRGFFDFGGDFSGVFRKIFGFWEGFFESLGRNFCPARADFSVLGARDHRSPLRGCGQSGKREKTAKAFFEACHAEREHGERGLSPRRRATIEAEGHSACPYGEREKRREASTP